MVSWYCVFFARGNFEARGFNPLYLLHVCDKGLKPLASGRGTAMRCLREDELPPWSPHKVGGKRKPFASARI
jgi:hypothetical protein